MNLSTEDPTLAALNHAICYYTNQSKSRDRKKFKNPESTAFRGSVDCMVEQRKLADRGDGEEL